MVRSLTSDNWRISIFFILLIAGVNLTPAKAAPVTLQHAALTPQSEEVIYRIQWMGITLGRATLTWQETMTRYHARIVIQTSGIAKVFNKQTRSLETTGNITRSASLTTYSPEIYLNHVTYKHKERDMQVRYNKDGIESSYAVTPPDDRRWRPEVPDVERDKALDIMTAIIYAYQHVQEHKEQFDFTIFDARRLSGIHYTRKKNSPILTYIGTRTANSGYTDKELKELEGDDTLVFVEMGDPHSRFVTRVYASIAIGTIEAIREHQRFLLSPTLPSTSKNQEISHPTPLLQEEREVLASPKQ